jgi:ubiquinone/menaquinone biosynthesis C-methylase UbiE
MNKALPTLTYYQDIKKALEDSFRILKKGGKAVYIIGKETVFYRSKTREVLYRVECDVIFKEIALNTGFQIIEIVDIELDKKNKNARPRSLDKYYESAII